MAMQPTDPEAMQLYQIIGAPLLAVVQAEVQAAQVSADFIRRVGFNAPPLAPTGSSPLEGSADSPPAGTASPPDGATLPEQSPDSAQKQKKEEKSLQDGGQFGDLKIAEFSIDRRDAQGNSQPYVVRVPVLSLYPIPLLQVKNAQFDYNIRIISRVPLQSPDEDVDTGYTMSKDYLAPDRVELKGMLGPGAGRGETSSAMSMRVKIQMEQSDIPAGLTKLLSIMEQNVGATPAPPKPGESPLGK
jgi:hypothetical protein